jgi:hypothetical protein
MFQNIYSILKKLINLVLEEYEIKREENACYSMPCFNGGKCLSDVNTFKCECIPGFYGTYCEAG